MKLPEFWKTGAALLVLAGLGSYIWFVERKHEPKAEGEREKVTVLAVDKAKAKEISLATAAGETIRLVKEGAGWKVTAPFAAPADTSAVESLLTSLEKLEADEVVVEQAASLAEYGLDKPSRTVTAVVEGAPAPLSVQFGAKSPDGSSVYARTGAAPKVYLVPQWVEGRFDKKPFDLRDRDLLHVKRDDVRSLEVVGPEGELLARADGRRRVGLHEARRHARRPLVGGRSAGHDREPAHGVGGGGRRDRREALRPRPARAGGHPRVEGRRDPDARDRCWRPGPDGRPSSFALACGKGREAGAPKPTKYYARQKGTSLVAVVPATLADDLAKGMGELRAKRLLEVATYETEGFDVAAGATKKTYVKSSTKDKEGLDKTQWKRTAPDAKELETTKVEDALFKMGGVEVAEFVDQPQALATYGLDAPVLKVTVKAKGESWIEVGKKDGAVYARRSGDAAVLKLDPAKAEELLKAFAEL